MMTWLVVSILFLKKRLLDAVNQLVDAWTVKFVSFFYCNPQSVTITVDISAKGDPTQSTFSGSYRKSAYNLKKFYVRDIFPVVRSSLSSHIFSALGCFWKHIRGPSLSTLDETIVERAWQEMYLETLNQTRFSFLMCFIVFWYPICWQQVHYCHRGSTAPPWISRAVWLGFLQSSCWTWGRWWWLTFGFFCCRAPKNCSI